jgi:hypothetical protein
MITSSWPLESRPRSWRLGRSKPASFKQHTTIDRFLDTYQDGRIKTPEDILPLIDSSRAQDLTAPLLVIEQSLGQMAT